MAHSRNICFESLTPAIDGNIRRVLSRLSTSETDLENTFVRFGNGALPADYFQSLMELGEQICLPNPRCNLCPVRNFCRAHRAGVQNKFPRKNNKKATEIMHWYLLILNSNNAFYYLRNSSRDFLKQAWIFPDLLAKHKLPERDLLHQFRTQHGIELHGIQEKRTISHAVTFRKIFTHVLIPENFRIKSSNGKWLTKRDFKQHPTSSITKKVLRSLEIQNRQTKPFQQSLKQS